MNRNKIVDDTISFVKETLKNEPTGHDWFHVERVLKLSEKIAKSEGGDIFKVKLIALLHDIADYKLYKNELEGVRKLQSFLKSIISDQNLIDDITQAINGISYKGAQVVQSELSKEGKIVQDADRLDAIGAIGIARTFAYGGNKNRLIYNPEEPPIMHKTFEEYKSSKGHTVNHFYEKLLLLKERLNTNTAKKIAQERHVYMENFLTQFYKEWNVEL